MPTYKGWDREVVLHQCPPTTGFTPINVSRTALIEPTLAQSGTTTQALKALHGTGTKTSRSGARKRPAPSKVTRQRKRKKSSNVSEVATTTDGPSCANSLSMDRSQLFQNIADESDYGEDIDLLSSHQLLPIYSQTTSMDLINQHIPMTSMHILKDCAPHTHPAKGSLADSHYGRPEVQPVDSCMTHQLPSPPNSDSIVSPLTGPAEIQRNNHERSDRLSGRSSMASMQGLHCDEHASTCTHVIVGESTQDKPSRTWKMDIREVDEGEDIGGALTPDEDRVVLQQLDVKRQNNIGRSPIVRLPFARPILDRSPIFGASAAMVLRTCFRIGEALIVGAQAVRTGKNVRIELYARVTSSQRRAVAANHLRQEKIQNFVFKDLYHDNPPYLNGTYALWCQSPLWELDSRPFLRAGEGSSSVMCRIVGKLQRVSGLWQMEVMSIWQASWGDVDAVAGIYSRAAE